MANHDSALVRFGIPSIALLLAATVLAAVTWVDRASPTAVRRRRFAAVAAGSAAWLIGLAVAGNAGVLVRFDVRPPPVILGMLAGVLMAVALGLSPLGRRLALGLPLPALVLFQGFRFPLELVMHQAAREGIMPSVMSYSGYNFDIVTGISALLLGGALLFRRVPLPFVAAWNLIGVLLLITIAAIAIAALPLFRAFGDDQLNVWITHFPYVWLLVMVAAAQLGHILISRRIIHDMRVNRCGRGFRTGRGAVPSGG